MSVINTSSMTKDSVLLAKEIKLEWEIKNILDIQSEDYFESPVFSLSSAEWFIRCYPNGHKSNNTSGLTTLYLFKKSSSSSIRVTVTLGIKKADGSVFKSFSEIALFPKEEKGIGRSSTFLRRSELKDEVVPNGVLTVICTIRLADLAGLDIASQTTFSNSVEELSENVKELFLNGYESDVTIRVKVKEFMVHKCILAARSTVFRSMFELDMLEKGNGEVNITDCEPDCFEDFLLFLYSGKADIVSSSNAMGLYLVADKYNIKDLKLACCESISQAMSVESVCDVVGLASMYNELELLETANQFFANNANSIFKNPKWLSFLAENVNLANELLIKMTNKPKE